MRERLSHVIVFRAPGARSLAWLERPADNREVASPNLAGPTPSLAFAPVRVTPMASPDAGPSPPTDRLGRWYLLAVFAAVAIVVAASYVVYSSQPPRTPRTDNLVFSRPAISDGNASFVVENTSGGPYRYYGFRVNLVVNGFAGESAPPGPGGMSIRFPIGRNGYVVVWGDA